MRDYKDLKIAVAGTGYVGLSIATLLAQHHHVVAVDVVQEKVDLINNGKSPIQDDYIEPFLAGFRCTTPADINIFHQLQSKAESLKQVPESSKESIDLKQEIAALDAKLQPLTLDLQATLDGREAYRDADFVVIAAPTNYDPVKNFFDTHHIEDVIDLVISVNPDAVMVIKSTIPVGYCRSLYVKYALRFMTDPSLKGKHFNLLFSPEFLRESKALEEPPTLVA